MLSQKKMVKEGKKNIFIMEVVIRLLDEREMAVSPPKCLLL